MPVFWACSQPLRYLKDSAVNTCEWDDPAKPDLRTPVAPSRADESRLDIRQAKIVKPVDHDPHVGPSHASSRR